MDGFNTIILDLFALLFGLEKRYTNQPLLHPGLFTCSLCHTGQGRTYFTPYSQEDQIAIAAFILIAASAIFYANARTWNKTEIEFGLVIDEQIVYRSTYGESPMFAIWLEDPESVRIQTIYVTIRAALGDWEGKADVPVALPRWFEIDRAEQQSKERLNTEVPEPLAITGAKSPCDRVILALIGAV